MGTKKVQLLIVIGSLLLLALGLTVMGGLAQQAVGEVYLPILFRANGGITPTQTATATPTPTGTATATPTGTSTPTATSTTDCALLTMSDFEIRLYNRPAVKITNNSANEIAITDLWLEWESAQTWAEALGYDDIHVDWFEWDGARFYQGDDYDHPTEVTTTVTLAPGAVGDWEIDFDWIGEQDWAFIDEFGFTQENFGFRVQFENGCVLYRPETISPPPTPTPTPTPTLDCGLLGMTDFEVSSANHALVSIVNNSSQDVTVTDFRLDWDSVYAWANAFGYDDIYVDWFEWDGENRIYFFDPTPPTSSTVDRPLPANSSRIWESDFDWGEETDGAFLNEFGLTGENFGFWVQTDKGCVLYHPETISLPPTPDCNAYSIGDFNFGIFGQIDVDIINNDMLTTRITGIELDWDYAEAYGEQLGYNQLNVDWMEWGNVNTWGGGNGDSVYDDDSTTNTAVDFPETFPGNWGPGLPPFETGITYTLRSDFDNEWPSFNIDLFSTDFGITLTLENGCTLVKETVPRPVPTPDCSLYSVEDFTIDQYNRINTTVTNGDFIPTEIDRIILDWDYAEAMSDLMIGPDNLYLDYLRWGGNYIWSNNWDGVGDFASVTDTYFDSPSAWNPNNTEFDAGHTYFFRADWEYAVGSDPDNAFLDWGLIPSDFGVTFYFENGCILERPVVTRTLPTPSPLDVALVLDISESMSWEAAFGDPLRDPAQCNDTTIYDGSEDAGEYPNFPDGFPGECHPFEEQKYAASEFVLNVLDNPEAQEVDRVAIVTYGNGWSSDPLMGTHLRTTDWTSNLTDTLALIRDFSMFQPEPCLWHYEPFPIRTEWGPCRRYEPPNTLNFYEINCISCMYPEPDDFSYKTSSNIGGGLLRGGNMFLLDPRPEASSVIVLTSDRMATATDPNAEDDIYDITTYPVGNCPNDPTYPLCQDEDVFSRHPYTDTIHYDADDYARDLADYVGCDPLNPAPGCPQPGVGATIFTIGLGEGVLDNTNEVNGLPYGVALLRYLAAVGDDGDPDTDPCEDLWEDEGEWETWCGNYYFANSDQDLVLALDEIFQRLILGLLW